jgi:hypothetical protein
VLYFGILTSPYDFDCSEDSCLTVHDVTFTVVGIKKGEYYVVLSINNETVHLSDVYPLSIK